MSRITAPRFTLDDTSALDDAGLTDDDVMAHAWSHATALAIGRAEREEKRSRAVRTQVAARRQTTDYEPVDPAITAYLAANPAF